MEAWRSEFWPPVIAESALATVTDLARKCAWLADPTARRQFAIAVPQVLPVKQAHNAGLVLGGNSSACWTGCMM